MLAFNNLLNELFFASFYFTDLLHCLHLEAVSHVSAYTYLHYGCEEVSIVLLPPLLDTMLPSLVNQAQNVYILGSAVLSRSAPFFFITHSLLCYHMFQKKNTQRIWETCNKGSKGFRNNTDTHT